MGYMEESKLENQPQSQSRKLFPIFETAKRSTGFVTPVKSQPS